MAWEEVILCQETSFAFFSFAEPSLSPTSTVLYTNGAVPYTFQNGVAVFGSDGTYATVPQQVGTSEIHLLSLLVESWVEVPILFSPV